MSLPNRHCSFNYCCRLAETTRSRFLSRFFAAIRRLAGPSAGTTTFSSAFCNSREKKEIVMKKLALGIALAVACLTAAPAMASSECLCRPQRRGRPIRHAQILSLPVSLWLRLLRLLRRTRFRFGSPRLAQSRLEPRALAPLTSLIVTLDTNDEKRTGEGPWRWGPFPSSVAFSIRTADFVASQHRVTTPLCEEPSARGTARARSGAAAMLP